MRDRPLFGQRSEAKKAEVEGVRIPGGIEGHAKKVDVEKETLTIVTTAGAERTFNVTDDTTMLGPRGGKVRRGLHDSRFQEGMELTVVASGSTAKEVHLGYRRRPRDAAKTGGQPTAKTKAPPAEDGRSPATKTRCRHQEGRSRGGPSLPLSTRKRTKMTSYPARSSRTTWSVGSWSYRSSMARVDRSSSRRI